MFARTQTCKTCRYWTDRLLGGSNYCARFELQQRKRRCTGERCTIDDDDAALLSDEYHSAEFVTGPDFGCSRWEP